ncbi:MAG: hypothetical protein GY757_25505, partial [bacterium]|nr:hypothetical protein [bacterium]
KSSLDIEKSLLIKPVILNCDDGKQKLLITAHHLVIDGVSWRILLEDLYNLYLGFMKGEEPTLPSKTASSSDSIQNQLDFSKNEALNEEIALWEKSHESDFSFDEENNEDYGSISDREKISFAIEADQTEILSAGCRKSFNSDIEVLLVTALGIVLKDHTGTENILLEMENNGRILDDIDLSRTMGWFTAMFPMLITIDKEDLTSLIKSVKEQLKTIPNSGMGYWLLKNISKKLTGDYKSRVRFNYLGQFDKEISNELFSHCDAYTGEEIGQENALSTLIEINCM